MGFFGGVAWAMLVARVCQLYPNACAGYIVSRFFAIYLLWKWPRPVTLKNIESGPMQLRVWNPQIYHADFVHKMPIITPAYPSMCATHNVSTSTKIIIESEFKRGAEITDKIMRGEASWTDLFGKSEYFRLYKYYLQVNTTSADVDSHNILHGFVESRLRQLILKLEGVDQIVLARPYVKSYDHEYVCKSDEDLERIRQGLLPVTPNASGTVEAAAVTEKEVEPKQGDGDSPATTTEKKAFTSAFYVGLLLKKEMKRSEDEKRVLDISGPTQSFIALVKDWDAWSDEGMAMSIRFLHQSQLPDEVFDGLPRDRLPSTLKNGSAKRKRESQRGRENGTPAPEKPAKKAKTSMAAVPSTSGVAAASAAESAAKTNGGGAGEGGDAGAKDVAKPMTAVAAGFAAIAAPVPPPPKQSGIKLKLLSSS
ncbi:polynucleotide adenylyltransferase [Coemansia sp. RSA 2052]|nr:polynucleotide adenylyltransferase [Coemansia sp. RSA 2052]